MSKSINLTDKDLDIIAMCLIDNAVMGHLNRNEYKLVWDILECLYEPTEISREELVLICNSLRRYANKYEHEHLEMAECKRVYDFILDRYNHE